MNATLFAARGVRAAVAIMLVLGGAASGVAGELSPLPAGNLTPFTAVIGQPPLRTAQLMRPGESQWRVDSALASHSGIALRDGDFVYLDGETLRLGIEYRRQLTSALQLAIVAPWLSHRRGFLDRLIDDWHALTGLSNGQRDLQGQDRLRYEFSGSAGAYRLQRSTHGPGDVRLEFVRGLPRWRDHSVALRLSVEAPLGDASDLTGNGAVDAALDLLVSGAGTWRGRPLQWHTHLGVLAPGDGDLLPRARRELLPLAGFATAWAWRPDLSLYAQVAILRGPWRTQLRELGDPAVELTLGIGWTTRRFGAWHLGFSEDVRIDRSPDFVARLGWTSQRGAP